MRTSLALGVVLALSSAIVACGDKDGDTGTDGTGTDTDGTDTDTDGTDTDTDTDGTDTDGTDTDTDGTTDDDADGDGYSSDEDCDDSDASVNPGAAEICDGIDNDCDDLIDDDDDDLAASGATTWYVDADADGYGNADDSTIACEGPASWVTNGDDCDDGDDAVHPGATEICNGGIDDDCDGAADDADDDVDPFSTGAFYADADGDGWGDLDAPIAACAASDGVVVDTDDCDDDNDAINPGATEICNDGVDDDCDGNADDLDASLDTDTWSEFYRDDDGDGYGLDDDTILRCSVPDGFAEEGGDCDDAEPAASPGGTEICDGGIDNDCDGLVDADDDDIGEDDYATWYLDADADGYGVDDTTLTSCDVPEGYSLEGGDCDDGDSAISPGADEVCDGADNDCDDLIDDDDDVAEGGGGFVFYPDADGDSWGSDEATVFCSTPEDGYVPRSGDCDDDTAEISPDAIEICDGVDNDCDELVDDDDDSLSGDAGAWYVDADGDGYGVDGEILIACDDPGDGWAATSDDCDDEDADVHPGAEEVCNGTDSDCDFTTTASGMAGWTGSDGAFTDLTDDLSVGTTDSPVDWALDEAGTLALCEGDWYLNLTASADVSIVGGSSGVTVYGGSAASVIAIEGEGLEVTISDLELQNGSGTGTTASGDDDGGGGIACADETGGTTVSVSGLRLRNHSAGQGAGIYAWGCDLILDDVELEFGSATDGGAIFMLDSDLAANNLRLLNNGASTEGGGLWFGGSSSSVTGTLVASMISRNSAGNGGGVFLSGSAELDVDSTVFELNSATLGGGVAIDGDTGTVLTVVSSDFGTDGNANNPDDIGLVGDESSYSGLGASTDIICDGTECVD